MVKKLLTCLVLLGITQPAYSVTRIDQPVTVLNYQQGKEKIYTKPFSELKLDKSTMALILDKNDKLDKTDSDSYHLAFIRIDNDLVTKLMFIGEKGHAASLDIRSESQKVCYLTLSSPQSVGGCQITEKEQ